MAHSLEDHCVDYILGLAPSGSRRQHITECVDRWRETYGEKFAAEVQKRISARRKELKK